MLDSVVLHFFVAPNGELRCRATDVRSRKTWMVQSPREVATLLRPAVRDSHAKEVEDAG